MTLRQCGIQCPHGALQAIHLSRGGEFYLLDIIHADFSFGDRRTIPREPPTPRGGRGPPGDGGEVLPGSGASVSSLSRLGRLGMGAQGRRKGSLPGR